MPTLQAELLPIKWGTNDDRSVVARLNQTLDAATALYASVAFWTIVPGYLSHRLQQLLGRSPSFCCVDLHGNARGGTRVERLRAFHEAGATELYLFLRKVAGSSELGLNRHLLHTKLLLFDLPSGRAELWVGSHNFTVFALGGGNREASLVLTLNRRTTLYRQAKAYLLALRQQCHRYQANLYEQYLELQGEGDEPGLECAVLPLLWDSQKLSVLGMSLSDQTALLLTRDQLTGERLTTHFGSRKPLLVWAYDTATGQASYWTAETLNAARISDRRRASSAMRYDHPLVITIGHGELPELRPREAELGPDLLRQFKHAFSLYLTADVTTRYQLKPLPAEEDKARWVVDAAATQALDQVRLQELALLAYTTAPAKPVLSPDIFSPSSPPVARWEAELERVNRTRRRPSTEQGTSATPEVLRPEFRPVQKPEAPDPLTDLLRRLVPATAARQQLRQRLGQRLQAELFTESRPTALTFLEHEAASITLSKVLLRYLLVHK